jgi:predicted oxidoreductase
MKNITVPGTGIAVSRIGYGCMKIGGSWDGSAITDADRGAAERIVLAAAEQGCTLFDHADIYCMGKSEQVFGEILRRTPGLRGRIVLQTKCGIRFPGAPFPAPRVQYDFSHRHIVGSVEGSLRRLQTDFIDILLLHRPDPLMEPQEVAEAFDELRRSGKVRWFGVSNHSAAQIELLRKALGVALVVNQLELNLLHCGMIAEGVEVNRDGAPGGVAPGLLDYCRLNGLQVQAWSPLAVGAIIEPKPGASEKVKACAAAVASLAARKKLSREAIALAWLLRHPAGIVPIVGTTNARRLAAACEAERVELSRDEWFELLEASRGHPLP